MDSLKLYNGTVRRYKIRNKVNGKCLGIIGFSRRGKFYINDKDLMKALNYLKRIQHQFNFSDLEIVRYRLVEETCVPIKEYFLERLI